MGSVGYGRLTVPGAIVMGTKEVPMDIAALCGSLRSGSYNQALLETAIVRGERFGLHIVQVSIEGFPAFSQELESNLPAPVVAAKELVSSADCVMLVTPEYNHGVPGVLKNAVDWLSRPFGDLTLRHRPMALMGASTGYAGSLRAQLAWRQMWYFFDAPVFSVAEMTLSFAARMVGQNGLVVDPGALERLDLYLEKLAQWLEEQR